VWFDGGVYSFQDSLYALLHKLQPHAIAFQGPSPFSNMIRWIGNEQANPPYPSWSTAVNSTSWGGGTTPEQGGVIWAPGESDTPIRNHGLWFWTDTYYDYGIKSVGELFQEYEQSVGRNTNMLLNLSPDPYGVVPVADTIQYQRFGDALRKCYAKGINSTSETLVLKQGTVQQIKLILPTVSVVNRIVITEEQTYGQLIRSYAVLYSLVDTVNDYKPLVNGTSVGNKRIEVLPQDIQARFLLLHFFGISSLSSVPAKYTFAAHLCDRLY